MKRQKQTSASSRGRTSGGETNPRPEKSQNSELPPGLYVVATPIGNARDITLRALDVLQACDGIAAEDTRVTAKLLAIHNIRKPLTAYNDHNGARERPRLIGQLQGGARIALVSDAGTPLVSDPGYKLVSEALLLGLAVHAIPGPSAPLTALTLSGLPSDRFLFAGFAPSKSGERRTMFGELKDVRATLIFFESPQRLKESLADMAAVFGKRKAAVARELTKHFEEVRRDDLDGLAAHYALVDAPKGEITVLVGPGHDDGTDWARADTLLKDALAFMPVRAASDLLSRALEVPRHSLYERALELKKADDSANE